MLTNRLNALYSFPVNARFPECSTLDLVAPIFAHSPSPRRHADPGALQSLAEGEAKVLQRPSLVIIVFSFETLTSFQVRFQRPLS